MAARQIDKVAIHPPNSPVVEFEVGMYGVTSIDVSALGGTLTVGIYKNNKLVHKTVGLPFVVEFKEESIDA